MASEYYKKKFQDVKPDEPYVMTKKEKVATWWMYHWHHVAIAIASALFVCVVLQNFVFRVRPDYKVAYIGEYYLDVDTEELALQLAELAPDINGDGKVVVQIRSYSVSETNQSNEADMVGLTGDIGVGGSSIYILDDSEWFINRYKVMTAENCYSWDDCPALANIDLGGTYDIGLRTDYLETDATLLWNAMIAGAE